MQVRQRESPEQCCPLCRDALGEQAKLCEGCNTGYHSECLAEFGGCGTLGCGRSQESAVEQVQIAEAAAERLTESLLEAMRTRGPGPRFRPGQGPLVLRLTFSLAAGLFLSWVLTQAIGRPMADKTLVTTLGMALPIALALFLITNLEDKPA